MRLCHNLENFEQKKYSSMFENITEISSISSEHDYECVAVSVFDHWLSEDEALEKLDGADMKEEGRRKALFQAFHEEVIRTYEVFTYTLKGKHSKKRAVFRRFNGNEAAMSYLKPKDYRLPSHAYAKIVIPALECIYIEGGDYTGNVYFKNHHLAKHLIAIAKRNGLHSLD